VILPRILAWILFAVWSTWCFALQARLNSVSSVAPFVPEIGLVLALSLLARLEEREAPILALIVALTRAAFSSEPAVVVLSGALGLSLLAMAVRSVVELTGPLWRTVTTGMLVAAFDRVLDSLPSAELYVVGARDGGSRGSGHGHRDTARHRRSQSRFLPSVP
jgi:hypothetical protein